LATGIALAQARSLDEAHIVPRARTVELASAAGPRPLGVIRTRADLVLVPVSITDDLNRPVIGLDQDNFELFENKKPQQIRNFSSEDTPVSIGILVDTSRSMSAKLDRAREAVTQFCEMANPQDEFFLITFADAPRLETDFTSRPEEIENDLLTSVSRGETSLLDAIYMGVDKLRTAKYARKALLILSDGGDNHSRYSEHDVKAAIREADITIFSLGTFERFANTQEELLGPELLANVAELTGGKAFVLSSPNQMPEVAQNIGTRLRHQYLLAYTPESALHDGRWHKINVKLRLPKKFPFLHVDARPGYDAGGE
jgi:Ca-activated chloride channel family protein